MDRFSDFWTLRVQKTEISRKFCQGYKPIGSCGTTLAAHATVFMFFMCLIWNSALYKWGFEFQNQHNARWKTLKTSKWELFEAPSCTLPEKAWKYEFFVFLSVFLQYFIFQSSCPLWNRLEKRVFRLDFIFVKKSQLLQMGDWKKNIDIYKFTKKLVFEHLISSANSFKIEKSHDFRTFSDPDFGTSLYRDSRWRAIDNCR